MNLRKIVIAVSDFLKSSVMGRAMLPTISKIWHKYEDPARRRRLLKYGYSVLNEISEIAIKENIGITPIFGTLLGFVRDGAFIPHDDDIDLGVFPGKSPKEVASLFVNKYGYTFRHGFSYHGECTEFTLDHKSGLTVDFFFLRKKETGMESTVYVWKKQEHYTDIRQNNVKFLFAPFDASMVDCKLLNGEIVKIPHNSEEILFYEYGRSWNIPDPNWVASDNPGTRWVSDYGYLISYEELMSDSMPK